MTLYASLLLALFACGDTAAPTETAALDTSGVADTSAPVQSDETNADGLCSVNAECPAAQRCECTEADGCACTTGPRGTGLNGVDTCTTGEDCASALCVEGDAGVFYCSDECLTNADCEAALPVCLDVTFVGRICTRDPSAQ